MKKNTNFLILGVALGMFFVLYERANAEPYKDYASSVCQSNCPKGTCKPIGIVAGVEMSKCIPNPGTLKQGETCEKQTDCGANLYCKDTVGDDECESKLDDGKLCIMGKNGDICKVACKSGKYYAEADGELGSVSWTCGNKPNNGAGSGADPGSPVPGTGSGTNSTETIKIKNPLAFSSVEEFVGVVLTRARQIIVVLALASIMIGAVMYVLSAGNTAMIGHAKNAITAALIGLAIGIAAPSFLKEIGTILGWDAGQNSSDVAGALTLSQIAMNILNFLLGIFGVLAMIMMVIGGITYLTAAGDENRIDKGKSMFKYSIIGILVAMSSLVIIKQLAKFFV